MITDDETKVVSVIKDLHFVVSIIHFAHSRARANLGTAITSLDPGR